MNKQLKEHLMIGMAVAVAVGIVMLAAIVVVGITLSELNKVDYEKSYEEIDSQTARAVEVAKTDDDRRVEKPTPRINVGVMWSGTKGKHTIHSMSLSYYAFPLKSTDAPGRYIDANGEMVSLPDDLIPFHD